LAAFARAFARCRAAARARACFARAAAFAFATARFWAAAAAAAWDAEEADVLDEVDPELDDVEDGLAVELDEVVPEERVEPDDVELDELAVGFFVGAVGVVFCVGAGSGVGPVSARPPETMARAAAVAASTLSAVRTAPL
jgi:hypothetical protein